jgi:hypothetical protein
MTRAPVVLFLYRRPDTTARVFAAIRRARPRQLMLVADGPRDASETLACALTRDVVAHVDWDCEVERNFAATNLGLTRRIETGLAWAFERVSEAVILEDDCLPHGDFFPFCDEMLDCYRHDERIMCVTGDNFHGRHDASPASYHFSRYPHIWGWATWKRAWRWYDSAMTDWPTLRDAGWLDRILESPAAIRYWKFIFERNHRTREAWDYSWIFNCWTRGGLTVAPAANLVGNIGFRADASHTRDADCPFGNLPTQPLAFPLRHPAAIARDVAADLLTEDVRYSGPEFLQPMFDGARRFLAARRMGA